MNTHLLMHLSCMIRSTLMGVGCWFPVIAFFVLPYRFGQLMPVWLLIYFGVAGNLSVWLMKRVFDRLVQREEGETESETQEEELN